MLNDNEKLDKRLNEIISNSTDNEGKKDPRLSQADQLVNLVNDDNCVLFHDQFKEPYAHLLVNDHWENHKIKSKLFSQWLSRLLWEKTGKAANPTSLQSALAVLKGKACFEGQEHHLDTRVVRRDEAIWYDLGTDQWQAVKITSMGWEVVNDPPILFCRYKHQQSQPIPQKTDASYIKKVEGFLNLAKPEYNILFLVYLASCFIPNIPHPIPIVFGPQGAAKSTLAKVLSKLIDPSSTGVSGMPSDQAELVRQLSHHWFIFFDNITAISTLASDLFCRAVTGEAFSKRELYSDDDDVIFAFQHCLGLNGINNCGQKPDLLERALLFRLESIPKRFRKSSFELWKRFEAERPNILGSIFTILAGAMKVKNSINLAELPRMADFTIWGCAITESIGLKHEAFLSAYNSNLNDQNDEAIQENPVALAIVRFMEHKVEWSGSASELLGELNTIADSEKLNAPGNGWPRVAHVLSRRLNEVKTNLAQVGISIAVPPKGPNGKRSIIMRNGRHDSADTAITECIARVGEVFGSNIKVETKELAPSGNTDFSPCGGTNGTSGDIFPQLF